jgi:23S rRNA (adenine2030-N6)-methyltransferase
VAVNYQHAFHAGNFADVFKHVVLLGIVKSLLKKPTPLFYLDTHSGAGSYDLQAVQALRTEESEQGIARLIKTKPQSYDVTKYLELVRSFNTAAQSASFIYPGSPLIAAQLLRDIDRLAFCEIQDAEYTHLKRLCHGDKRIAVHRRDGYQAMAALLPPKERRGLILIDPPYEKQDQEFDVIVAALQAAIEKFASGVYAIWYPIKLRQPINAFHRKLQDLGLSKILIAEFCPYAENTVLRLNGCGMAIINAPWKLDDELAQSLPELLKSLTQSPQGRQSVSWLS